MLKLELGSVRQLDIESSKRRVSLLLRGHLQPPPRNIDDGLCAQPVCLKI